MTIMRPRTLSMHPMNNDKVFKKEENENKDIQALYYDTDQ